MRLVSALFRRSRLLGLALALLCGAGALAVETGWAARQADRLVERGLALSVRAGFAVGEVVVVGRERTPASDVRSALGATAGAPILAVDIRGARERIEALPWVREAEVERALPNLLVVRLVERETLAVWDRGADFAVIDGRGRPIAGADPKQHAHLPVIRGARAPEEAPAMLAMLRREPDIARRITGLSHVSGRRWNVHLDWRIEVRLPEEEAAAAWTRLAQIDRERRLLDGEVALIDMRFRDRMVLRMAGNEAGERS